MDTPAPDQLTHLEGWLEHQQARLADVRDRLARVVLQQRDIAAHLRWLNQQLAQFQQLLDRGNGQP